MNYLRFLPLLVLPFLFIGCASTPKPPPQYRAASNSFTPPAGKAGLYVFKEGSLIPATDSHQISLDGQLLGIVSSSSFIYSPITPGAHVITGESGQVNLTAQAGQNYFVKQKTLLNSSGQIIGSTLTLVTPAVGKPQIQELQGADMSE